MKNDTSPKQVAETQAALARVEQCLQTIQERRDKPLAAWRERQKELERLKREHALEVFDPSAPSQDAKLALRAVREQRIGLLEQLQRDHPANHRFVVAKDGTELISAFLKLKSALWQIAEPFELAYEEVARAGLVIDSCGYSPLKAEQRFLSYLGTFGEDAGQILVRLAKQILTRKLPPLPAGFGLASRPLTRAEKEWLDGSRTEVEAR